MVLFRDIEITLEGIVPYFLVLRHETLHLDAVGNDFPHFPNVLHHTTSLCLHHDVSYGCAFLWSSKHFHSCRIGCKLVQVRIEGATSYDMQDVYIEIRKLLEP